jgi:hypothetical protein
VWWWQFKWFFLFVEQEQDLNLNLSTTADRTTTTTVGTVSQRSQVVNKNKKKKKKKTEEWKVPDDLIVAYRATVRQSLQHYKEEKRKKNTTVVDMTAALECLQRTSKLLSSELFHYPSDAVEHFHTIRLQLAPWAQHEGHHIPHTGPGYSGPWIENYWITYFEQQLLQTSDTSDSTSLDIHSLFGPYIPLLIPWTDIWHANGGKHYPHELYLTLLLECLRPNVLYITVVQNDDGFPANDKRFQELQTKFHITILSAGGYGHVPLPLLKQLEPTLEYDSSSSMHKHKRVPMSNRTHGVSYVGSSVNAPRLLRQTMIQMLTNTPNNGFGFHYGYGPDWRSVMADSKFSLCPRGFGRTSYHLMETLQMGLIPIQVYLTKDQPWIPYQALLQNDHNPLTLATDLEGLPALLAQLELLGDDQLEAMESTIVRLRDAYFTYEGVMRHIHNFMLGNGKSDLICQRLPETPGTNRASYFTK